MTAFHVDREELMAWLDAEVPPVRRLEIERHLEMCATCRGAADELRRVSTALAAWTIEAAPSTLLMPATGDAPSAVADAARRTSQGGWTRLRFDVRRWSWRQWAVPIGGAAAVVALIVVSLQRDGTRSALRTANAEYGRSSGRQLGGVAGQLPVAGQIPGLVAGQEMELRAPTSPIAAPQPDETLVIKTARIRLIVDEIGALRAAVERLVREQSGSIEAMSVSGEAPGSRTLSARLRVPVARLDAMLAALRLGQVVDEQQAAADVSSAHRDLAIRIANARVEEQRLNELLARRTGNLKDVLEVEREQSRVRGEIEQMTAEERTMRDRAALCTITVEASERRKPDLALGPLPVTTQLANASIDGLRAAVESVLGAALVVLQIGPSVLLWFALLAPPAWLVWRRRSRQTS